jgi:hypothetical protein
MRAYSENGNNLENTVGVSVARAHSGKAKIAVKKRVISKAENTEIYTLIRLFLHLP